MVVTSTSPRAATELVLRTKEVIIVVGASSKEILLLLLLLPATKEGSLLSPGGVQKVIKLSSCASAWMTNLFTKDRWEVEMLWPRYPEFS